VHVPVLHPLCRRYYRHSRRNSDVWYGADPPTLPAHGLRGWCAKAEEGMGVHGAAELTLTHMRERRDEEGGGRR
jgi:hypothetical protein